MKTPDGPDSPEKPSSDDATPGDSRQGPEPKLTREQRAVSGHVPSATAAAKPAPILPAADDTPPKRRGRLRVTLRTTILSLLVAIIGALSAVLISTAWYYSASNARDLSTQLMDRLTRHVVDRTTGYLEPADKAAGLCRELTRSGVIRPQDEATVERFFFELLRAYPQLAMINLGDEQGNFLMLKRFPVATDVRGQPVVPARAHPRRGAAPARPAPRREGAPARPAPRREGAPTRPAPRRERPTVTAAKPLLEAARLRPDAEVGPYRLPRGSLSTKIIRRGGSAPFVLWKYRDADHRLRRVSLSPTPRYDPRGRPWYRQAKRTRRQGWTGVYLFYTDKKPGIASTTPLFDARGRFRGAVSVEMELYRISEFLADKKVGAQGRLFLVNPEREIVAYSDVEHLRRRVAKDGASRWALHRVDQSPAPEVRASFAALQRRGAQLPPRERHIFEFTEGGRRWFAMYSPFPARSGIRWTVGILVPEEVVMGTIQRNRWMSVLISLVVILCAVLLAVFLSRAISRPLGRLVEEADRIRRLELREDVEIRSALREVDQMVTSVSQMKAGLRSFEKYVPRDLVRQLVRTGREAKVQGERREVSILFSDIAGFTSIAEGLDPEALVAHLNRYFDATTNVLLTHGATIDKYIGDAIMAFWGAPRQQADHAERACRAAWGLRHALDELNAEWIAAGHPPMHTRVGVHTGEVVVGNIGSDERLSYTIIGDAVNLASRIEGINKTYGTWVTVSEHTYHRVQSLFAARAVDVVAVKGRREGVRLYALLGLRARVTETELAIERVSAEALEHYRVRRWDAAIQAWEALIRLRGGADPAAELLIERCRTYQQSPPPEGWDGVWIASHK